MDMRKLQFEVNDLGSVRVSVFDMFEAGDNLYINKEVATQKFIIRNRVEKSGDDLLIGVDKDKANVVRKVYDQIRVLMLALKADAKIIRLVDDMAINKIAKCDCEECNRDNAKLNTNDDGNDLVTKARELLDAIEEINNLREIAVRELSDAYKFNNLQTVRERHILINREMNRLAELNSISKTARELLPKL